MKNFIVFVIFFSFFLFHLKSAYASTLYSSPLDGSDTFSTDWTLKSGSPTFSSAGLSGTFDYYKDVGSYDQVISFDTVYSAPRLLFACRTNFDYSYIEQLNTINNSSAVNLVEGINSNFYSRGPSYAVPASGNHHYELSCLGNVVVLKIDGTIYQTLIADTLYDISSHGVRLYSSGSELTISNLRICDTTNCSSPSITLNVPLLKQTSNPWQSQTYDSANKWSPGNATIGIWGCAITDVTMVFQYFGITKMPDGSPLNPSAINTWLKSQSDGYIANGYVNWWALQRLSKLIKLAFNNPNYTADALEYKRTSGENKNLLTTSLQNNIPEILEEPGHFIVATGTKSSQNTFTINDPYFARTLLTDGYNNTFLSSGRYVPSHTDLSSLLLVGPQDVDFSLKTSSGSAIGEEFVQQPLQNPTNPSQTNGPPVKIFIAQQPAGDTYTLTITSNSPYSGKAYLYDQSGNVQISDLNGSGSSSPESFTISFVKTDSHQDKVKKMTIFDQLLADITQFYLQNKIKKTTANELREEVSEIENKYNKQHFLQEKIGLAELLIKLIIWNNNHTIPNDVYQALVGDITFLLTH